MNEPTILKALQQVSDSDTVPMHMPGHKRNGEMAPYLARLGAELDITEIHGCDCLHHADGIIRQAMERAKGLWQVPYSYLLINGSTGGILAAIHAATRRGDGVLMARGCHRAVYHGVALCGLDVHYLVQSQQPEGYYCGVSSDEVERGLKENPDVRLVILTSPTYEGYLSDVEKISEICHRHGAALMVDEAHGAHLGFSDYFTGSAVSGGADIVVQSLHKTLPSLTQTAIVHLQGSVVDGGQLGRSLTIFETSSPSYLLMASIDGCLQLLEEEREKHFAHWQEILEKFYERMKALQKLDVVQEHPTVKDPSKIIIATAGTNLDGTGLKERLRTEFHIELEMAYGDYALAMTGMGDGGDNLERLAEALLSLDSTLSLCPQKEKDYTLPALPVVGMPLCQTHNCTICPLSVDEAEGKLCGGYIWAYPPGVPIVAPGEVVDGEILTLLQKLEEGGLELQDTLNLWPKEIGTIGGNA